MTKTSSTASNDLQLPRCNISPTSIPRIPPSKAELYEAAARRMRRGKRLVVSGFVVAVLGIIGYCVACFSASVDQQLSANFLANPGWLVGPPMAVIGLGTLLWLIGSFIFLDAAMGCDPERPDGDF